MPILAKKEVSQSGLGLMRFTWADSTLTDDQSFTILKAALTAGVNVWNGADFYGTPENNSLHLMQRYFSIYPEDASQPVHSTSQLLAIHPHRPHRFPTLKEFASIRNGVVNDHSAVRLRLLTLDDLAVDFNSPDECLFNQVRHYVNFRAVTLVDQVCQLEKMRHPQPHPCSGVVAILPIIHFHRQYEPRCPEHLPTACNKNLFYRWLLSQSFCHKLVVIDQPF